MKKSWIIIIIIVILGFITYSWFKGTYNNMVTLSETVDKQWADVENVYQRRADLIPNLVATVKGYASHEKETLEGVINARAKATSTTINAGDLTPGKIAAFQQAQDGLSSALSKLMVVVERYPELKANQNFLELQAQLEGTENRIAVERRKFNESARNYNTYIKLFPKNMLANMFGFEKKPYFEAQEGADEAPKVEF
ncbi:MAG TPA: LemA family protein [Bacteroidales bacterium]|jgi:LemA protein|nr:LemA family protein [Bacteroidota bacterium]HJN06498.1 LemA family protein [Bacteroidales bacterium]